MHLTLFSPLGLEDTQTLRSSTENPQLPKTFKHFHRKPFQDNILLGKCKMGQMLENQFVFFAL